MKIYIADDQPLDRSMLKIALEKWDYEVVECEDGTQVLELLLEEKTPKLAILDWMMPGLSGPQVCEEIRKQNSEEYTYIVLLTSKDEKADIVEGLNAGADDYIIKPVDISELKVRLRTGKRIIQLQHDLIIAREALHFQAMHDFLTGLMNRAAISETLEKEISRAARDNHEVGVILADIDHFKAVNDSYGHPAGDAILCEVAQRMLGAVRGYDSVGRYGGEEFLIVVPESDARETKIVAERILDAIADKPIETDESSVEITISIGTASGAISEKFGFSELIGGADKALYDAKATGRNRIQQAAS